MVSILPGCEDEPVHSYQAPKADPYVPPLPMGTAGVADVVPTSIAWELPEGWLPVTGGSGMAMASFDVPGKSEEADVSGEPVETGGPESGAARVTVTSLAGQAGGILANINRWRRQVGLEPIQVIEEQPMTAVHVDKSPAGLIDLASPPDISAGIERILVVLLPRQQDNQTWFFKMIGPNDAVTQHKDDFIKFVESVTFQEAAGE
jgi:hypothetical protein